MTDQKTENPFAKLAQASSATTVDAPKASQDSGEFNADEFDDTPVGDQKKYVRESLEGKKLKIKRFQVFKANPDTDEERVGLNNPNVKYFKVNCVITYDAKNKDGVEHREYMSGARQFVQRDGGLSVPQFWYKGTTNQIGGLWETVAAALGVKAEELSPRTFVSYLNAGPMADIKSLKFKNMDNATKASKPLVEKNIPVKLYPVGTA